MSCYSYACPVCGYETDAVTKMSCYVSLYNDYGSTRLGGVRPQCKRCTLTQRKTEAMNKHRDMMRLVRKVFPDEPDPATFEIVGIADGVGKETCTFSSKIYVVTEGHHCKLAKLIANLSFDENITYVIR